MILICFFFYEGTLLEVMNMTFGMRNAPFTFHGTMYIMLIDEEVHYFLIF